MAKLTDFDVGFEELDKEFDRLYRELPDKGAKVLLKVGTLVQNEIKQEYANSLIDPTGDLAGSIKKSNVKNGVVTVSVSKEFNIYKALWNEYGTVKQPARPIFFPTVARLENRVVEMIENAISEVIDG